MAAGGDAAHFVVEADRSTTEQNELPVLIVTGLKQEARIAAGPGLTVICSSSNPVQLREMMVSFDPASIRGIVSFGVAGGLNPSLRSGDIVVASGIAPLPYYPDVPGAPQNTVIGGASLWVMAGKKPAEYKGVAAFFQYLSKAEVASESHKRTGYLPVTKAAYELTEQSGFYKQNPGTDVAVQQMIRKTTDKSRGVRLGNFAQIRTIIDEEMEQVWAGRKQPKEGLDAAVKRGNELLERFEKANK